jgi:hypothetical protein
MRILYLKGVPDRIDGNGARKRRAAPQARFSKEANALQISLCKNPENDFACDLHAAATTALATTNSS